MKDRKPNLQNVPVRTAAGADLRRCFVPTGPMPIPDYAAIELRLLASKAYKDKPKTGTRLDKKG